MGEEEPGVEVQHPFPHRRKAEMARFDDPGMDRANRKLIDALAVRLERDVAPIAERWRNAGRHVLAQRVVALRPAFVEDEPARIRVAQRDQPEQVLRFTLIPARGGYEASH